MPDEPGISIPVGIPGVPGLAVHIPIRASLFTWLKRGLLRQPPEQLVRIATGHARVHIPATDAGDVYLNLDIVNMTDRVVQVEDFKLHRCTMSGVGLAIPAPTFTPPQKPVEPFGMASAYVELHLDAAAIRSTLRALQPADNTYSTPRVQLIVEGRFALRIGGSFWALQGSRSVWLAFQVDARTVEFNIYREVVQQVRPS